MALCTFPKYVASLDPQILSMKYMELPLFHMNRSCKLHTCERYCKFTTLLCAPWVYVQADMGQV